MEKLSPLVEEVLRAHGWTPDRNIYSAIQRDNKQKMNPRVREVISNFGLLEVPFRGREGKEVLYFDVDNSEQGKMMRARSWGFEDYRQINNENEPDFNENINLEQQVEFSKKIGQECFYIGFNENYLGFNLFMTESGEIYVEHGWIEKSADSIEQYLNRIIVGVM